MGKRNRKKKVSCPELARLALNYAYNVKRATEDERELKEFGWTIRYDAAMTVEYLEQLVERCVEGGEFALAQARMAEELTRQLKSALKALEV